MNKGQANRLLGYPVDARLLILNADDFEMCHAVIDAIFPALKEGLTLWVDVPALTLARFVELSIDGTDAIFSDNYFDIPAGTTVTVTTPCLKLDRGEYGSGAIVVRLVCINLFALRFYFSRM